MDSHDVDQELAFWPMYAMYAGMLAQCTKVATIVASCLLRLLGGRLHIDLASSAFRVGTCGLAGVENGRDIADRMQLEFHEFNQFNWFNGMLGAQSSQSCAGVAGVP